MSSINARVTVKKRIIVNSHEYARPEDMPDEPRMQALFAVLTRAAAAYRARA